MLTFLHAADLHLDSPLKGLARYEGAPVEEIQQASRRALENLVRRAIEEEAALVLFAGDIYDGDWPDHNTGLFFVKQLVKLREHNIRYYVITGNHDAANRMTRSLELPPNHDGTPPLLSHRKAESVVLDDVGVALHGQSFASQAVAENFTLAYPKPREGFFNIGMLHTSLDGETSGEHARYAPCKLSDLSDKGYQYWALGHIHKRHTRHADGQAPIVYPGNLQGRHIREDGPKGCMVVRVDDHHRTRLDFVPLDVFRWRRCGVDATDAEDCEEVLARAGEALSASPDDGEDLPTAVRVEIAGACPAHAELAADPERWTAQVRNIALQTTAGRVWIEKVKLRTTPPSDVEPPEDGPLAEIRETIESVKHDEEQLANLAQMLGELYRRLPDELRGSEGVTWDSRERLHSLLDEVEPLLLGRLSGRDVGSE
ncbi:MAG: DNA repair exonuclease [Planctomycetes bacterium]|nr:DNA repair exonuclease [Planctomycetota bacterium]